MTKKLAEVNFQSKLKTDLKEQGWHIIKNPSGMGFVVLDLFVTSLLFGPAWIELKTAESSKRKITLSRLQREEMRKQQKAGCLAVCFICVRTGNDDRLYITSNPNEEYINEEEYIERKFRTKWNAKTIGRRLNLERARHNLWG